MGRALSQNSIAAVRSTVMRSTVMRPRPLALDTAARRNVLVVRPQVVDAMDKHVIEYPHMDALKMWTEDGEAHLWTYKQLQKHVDAFCDGILEMGFKPNHKLVLWAKDTCESVVAQMGALKAGIQIEVLDKDATKEDLIKALTGSRAFLISPFVLPNGESMNVLYDLIPELEEYGRQLEQTVMSEAFPTLRWVWAMGFEKPEGMLNFVDVLTYFPPEVSQAPKMAAPGTIIPTGMGNFVDLSLPHIDPEVKIHVEIEDDDL